MTTEKEKNVFEDLFHHLKDTERLKQYQIFSQKALQCLRKIEENEPLLYFFFDAKKTKPHHETLPFQYGHGKGEVRLSNAMDNFYLFLFEEHKLIDKLSFSAEESEEEMIEKMKVCFSRFIKKKRLISLFSEKNTFFFDYVVDRNDLRHRFVHDVLEEIDQKTEALYEGKREEAHAALAKNIRDTGQRRKLQLAYAGVCFELHRLAQHYLLIYFDLDQKTHVSKFFPLKEKEQANTTLQEHFQNFIAYQLHQTQQQFDREDTDLKGDSL